MQNLITLALQGKTDQVIKDMTKFFGTQNYYQLQDNLARIAIIKRDYKLFDATQHHPRILLEEYAPYVEDIKFIVDVYRDNHYWNKKDVPSYVWHNASLASAKYMADANHEPLNCDLGECCEEVQQYFNYVAPCFYCQEEIKEEGQASYCPTCNMRLCLRCANYIKNDKCSECCD